MATVRYIVDEVDVAVDFYTKRLGFKVGYKMLPAFATVVRDDLTLWLAGPQSSAARTVADLKPAAGTGS